MEPGLVHGRRPTYAAELMELLRILVVAGVSVGVVAIGVGSRLAMLALRLTSPGEVDGRLSDDGFVIGRFTLAGSYNLVVLGAAAGVIGAAAYVAVSPWLIGARWFRRVTVAVTAAALVGSMLLHADGVDFTLLEPLWFAVALFITLPAVVGLLLTYVVDAVAAPDSWTARGRLVWVLPLVLLALVPPAAPVVVLVALVVALLLPLRRLLLEPLSRSSVGTAGVRAAFFVIPVLSAAALGNDLAELF